MGASLAYAASPIDPFLVYDFSMANKNAPFRRKAIIYALAALTFLACIPFFPKQGIVKAQTKTALECAFFLVPPVLSQANPGKPSVECDCKFAEGMHAPFAELHMRRRDGVVVLFPRVNQRGRSVLFGVEESISVGWGVERYMPIKINTPNGIMSDEDLGIPRQEVFAAFVDAVREPHTVPYPSWFFPPSISDDGVKSVSLQNVRVDSLLSVSSAIVSLIFTRASLINLIRYRRSLRPVGKRLCPMCAYELEGLPPRSPCPECGHSAS